MGHYAHGYERLGLRQKGYEWGLKALSVLQPDLYPIATKAYDMEPVASEPAPSFTAKHDFFYYRSTATDGRAFEVVPEDIGQLSVSDASSLFFRNATLRESIDRTINILDVESIAASKSDLWKYDSIADFGEKMYFINRRYCYHAQMDEDQYFAHCLGGLKSGGNRFSINCWSPSLKWNNSDGSHRFSTAYFMAKRQDRTHEVEAKITINRLNRVWIAALLKNYDMYIFQTSQDVDLFKLFDIHESRHTYVARPSPMGILSSYEVDDPLFRTILLLLHKAEKLSYLARHWVRQNLGGMEFACHYAKLLAVENATLMRHYLRT